MAFPRVCPRLGRKAWQPCRMLSVLLYELALVAVIGAGWLVGSWLERRYRSKTRPGKKDSDGPGTARLTDTIAFVGGAYGILLGLLLVFAVGHFVEARQVTKDEAATVAALFNSVDPFPADVRDPLRHDLICYIDSVSTDDWSAARNGDLTGSENTSAYAAKVQAQIQALPQDEDVESSNHYFVTEENLDLAKYRQLRLLSGVPEIPPVIWGVLYISAFLFIGLTVFHLGRRRWLTRLAVTSTALMLLAVTGALIQLDAPYVGIGTSLRPAALDATVERLRAANPEPASLWAECDGLENENESAAN